MGIQRVRAAFGRGLEYVSSVQREDGVWQDFEIIPWPGLSDAWITGYVLRALVGCGTGWAEGVHRGAVSKAGLWLTKTERPNGGWGYNAKTRIDADTTANVLLGLRRLRLRCRQKS